MLSEQVEYIQGKARKLARDCGYTTRFPPGRFEGEPWFTPYFWAQVQDGMADCPLCEGDEVRADFLVVTEDECEAFGLAAATCYVALVYSSNGFISLEEFTADEHDRAFAQAADEAEERESKHDRL